MIERRACFGCYIVYRGERKRGDTWRLIERGGQSRMILQVGGGLQAQVGLLKRQHAAIVTIIGFISFFFFCLCITTASFFLSVSLYNSSFSDNGYNLK